MSGLSLHLGNSPGCETKPTLAVFVKHAILEKLLEHVGRGLVFWVVHHLLDGFERLFAMLHDELHQLVHAEELVRSGEFIAVIFVQWKYFMLRELYGCRLGNANWGFCRLKSAGRYQGMRQICGWYEPVWIAKMLDRMDRLDTTLYFVSALLQLAAMVFAIRMSRVSSG